MAPFSVLMSLYCKESPQYLREALDSIFAQTVLPAEIVLVEDGPLTDALHAVVDEYRKRHPIFKIVKNPHNLGLGPSLAKGILHCSHEYVARMDSDDSMPADRFEKQLEAIGRGYDVVSCWSLIFDASPDNPTAVKRRPETHQEITKLARRRSPVCHAAAFMRKSAVLAAGNYQARNLYEDYHLWVRMILSGARFHNIQEVLYYVRTNPAQIARRQGTSYLKTELRCMKEFRNMGFYSATDLCINAAIRIVVRLLPARFAPKIFTIIWNRKN